MQATKTVLVEQGSEPSWIDRWNQFWFRPTDPTLLGAIRIVCGLITLYVHLAYTVDLQELLGPRAWLDRDQIEEFRHHTPFQVRTFDWSDTDPSAAIAIGSPGAQMAQWTPEQQFDARLYNVNPRQVQAHGAYIWSIWFHVTDPVWMAVTHAVILAIMLCFVVGLATPVTSVLTWIAAVSYVQRAPNAVFGMDTMMNLLLIYLMIGQSGAALSVDRLIARYRATRQALRRRGSVPASLQPTPTISSNIAIHCIQINLCIIYLASGLSKLQGGSWWMGTAVWGTLSNSEFSPLYYAPFYGMLRFLCSHRWLWELCMTGGSIFTLVIEIGFPFLVWNRRLRPFFLAGAVMLHTGIAVFMGLNTFSLMMLAMLLSFVPSEAVLGIIRALGRGAARLDLRFDGRVAEQARAASLIHALDPWEQVRMIDTASGRRPNRTIGRREQESDYLAGNAPRADVDLGTLQVCTAEGESLEGYPAFRRLVSSLRILQPFALAARVPGMRYLLSKWWPSSASAHRADPLSKKQSPEIEQVSR